MIVEVRSDSQLIRFIVREDDPGTVYVQFGEEDGERTFVGLPVTELAKMTRTVLAAAQ